MLFKFVIWASRKWSKLTGRPTSLDDRFANVFATGYRTGQSNTLAGRAVPLEVDTWNQAFQVGERLPWKRVVFEVVHVEALGMVIRPAGLTKSGRSTLERLQQERAAEKI